MTRFQMFAGLRRIYIIRNDPIFIYMYNYNNCYYWNCICVSLNASKRKWNKIRTTYGFWPCSDELSCPGNNLSSIINSQWIVVKRKIASSRHSRCCCFPFLESKLLVCNIVWMYIKKLHNTMSINKNYSQIHCKNRCTYIQC